MVRCAIWHYLYNFKNVKSTHGGVLNLKLTLLHGRFSRLLNCTIDTKSLIAPHIYSPQLISPKIPKFHLIFWFINYAFLQNIHSEKFGPILVFYAVRTTSHQIITAWKVSLLGFFFWSGFSHIRTEYEEIRTI